MQTAKFARKAAGFFVCFIVAFMVSRYGMPLYPLTAWLVEHSHQIFSSYQDDVYEAGADPVTFFSLVTVIALYALAMYWLVKMAIKKVKTWIA
ncbi:hypothetical protein SAMN05428971_2749 [Candidatus Pantoea varia]|uniref:Uncharacterized protein n=1 Tax=Candidatus Pantoea varia TaxID=1881036 RepID=A0A1I5E3E9_9GAMM|nr:hypothetical protein [Pantoea varia]SFO05956.1 hypothetical protein SAMN05428971_2749 [Pantoea varia]